MDKSLATAAPYFDAGEVGRELMGLLAVQKGAALDARPAVLDKLKLLLRTARTEAERHLAADGNGRRCAEGLSAFQDELIRLVYDYTVANVYRATNPSDAERMAIIATGGYGRGLLAPFSDVDLLFLLPYKQTPWGESVVEYMLYLLWDLGLKVGHATRTVEQCLKLARTDITIRTALLDSRLILGDQSLFDELTRRFRREVVSGTARQFVEAKLAERDERHRRAGESRYRVEPNIKDGKGGLRDLHTLHWLAKYLYGDGVNPATVEAQVFTSEEYTTFRRCVDFLWSVRCNLHFLAGRAEERLTFDVQTAMAERLGYVERRGLRAVERFMKHYFLVAKDVGDLTTILCSALEIEQVKPSPGITQLLNPLTWRTRRRIRANSDFRIDNGRLNVADAEVFKRDPVNLIRFFAKAEQTGAFFHPNAVRLLRRSLRLIDDKLRNDPEANRIFLEMLCSDKNPEPTLRRMNEAGVLGRFVPDFGKVVSMMQFNMYHHYTVDEHLIRAVGVLSDIEHGAAAEPHPLSTSIIKTIQHRRALYVATFLHDIAKGRLEDHSKAGAQHRAHALPALRPERGRDRDRRLARRAPPAHERDRLQPRHRRPAHDPRLRRRRAEPGAAEAAAGADGGRHPRGGPERLERLEGPAAARALLRDRAGGRGRAHAARRARPHRRGPGRLPCRRRRLARGGGGALRRPALSRLLAEDRHAQGRRALQARGRAPSGRARSSPAPSPPTPSPPSPSCRCSRPTIPACWRCSPAPAPPPAPTSRARTSPPPATASRSTPSCSPASSTATRTSCAAPGASPRRSRSC